MISELKKKKTFFWQSILLILLLPSMIPRPQAYGDPNKIYPTIIFVEPHYFSYFSFLTYTHSYLFVRIPTHHRQTINQTLYQIYIIVNVVNQFVQGFRNILNWLFSSHFPSPLILYSWFFFHPKWHLHRNLNSVEITKKKLKRKKHQGKIFSLHIHFPLKKIPQKLYKHDRYFFSFN